MSHVTRYWKRYLLGGLFAVFALVVGCGVFNTTYAQWGPSYGGPSTQDDTVSGEQEEEETLKSQLVEGFQFILQALYLILRPLLAIAGASLDNSLVYGEIFYLDRSLRQFRNMMRNFANFTLGFIFVGSLLVYFFRRKEAPSKITKTVLNLFIAGVLINMSWFLTAALIDFSTIMTVNIGALPLSVVGTEENAEENVLQNVRYLKIHSYFNLDHTDDQKLDYTKHAIVYSCYDGAEESVTQNMEAEYFLPCVIDNEQLLERGDEKNAETRDHYKKEFIDSRGSVNAGFLTEDNVSNDYCVYGYDLIENDHGAQLTPESLIDLKEKGLEKMKEENRECSTLDKLITNAKGMSGPLFTLYASILNMGENALSVNTQSLTEAGLTFMIRSVIGLALIIPLFALAVVLVVRAVILWVIIAFSPFLVLIYVFGKTFDVDGIGGQVQKLNNVLGLIFLPVFATFAISISIIFLSLFSRIDLIDQKVDKDPLTLLGPEKCEEQDTENRKCYNFFGITEITISESEKRTGANILNIMSRLVVNSFGIALMWTVIFFALRSSKMTASISDRIQSVGKKAIEAQNIIPVPGHGLTSVGGLSKSVDQIGRLPEENIRKDYGRLKDRWLGGDKDEGASQEDIVKRIEKAAETGEVNETTYQMSSGQSYRDIPDYQQKLQSTATKQGFTNDEKGKVGFLAANDLTHFKNGTHVNKAGTEGKQEKQQLYREREEQFKQHGEEAFGYSDGDRTENWYRHKHTVTNDQGQTETKSYLSRFIKGGDEPVAEHVEFPRKQPETVEDWQTFGSLIGNLDAEWTTFSSEQKASSFFRHYIDPVNRALQDPNNTTDLTMAGTNYTLTVTTDQTGNKIQNIDITER